MQHTWKSLLSRLAHVVMFAMVLVFMNGIAQAQTLAFSPGSDVVVAGNPSTATLARTNSSAATYVGPAAGWIPDSNTIGAAIDNKGNVYIAESYLSNIVRVIASGNGPIPVLPLVANPQAGYVYTVAGTGVNASGTKNPIDPACSSPGDIFGDGCLATQASWAQATNQRIGLAVDANQNLYIASNSSGLVQVVYGGTGPIPGLPTGARAGYIYAIAGNPKVTSNNANAIPATTANVGEPEYIAVDSNGNIYFDDIQNKILNVIYAGGSNNSLPDISAPVPGYVYTLVGNTGTAADMVAATSSKFEGTPSGIAIDAYNNIYVGDKNGVRVIYVNSNSSIPGLSGLNPGYIYTVAGSLTGGGTAPAAFPTPSVAVGAGLVANSTFTISALTFDQSGSLYFAVATSTGRSTFYRLDASGYLTSVYGTGPTAACLSPTDSEDDGCTAGTSSQVNGLVVDPQGNIWATDSQYALVHEQNAVAPSYVLTPGLTQPVVIYNTGSKDLHLSGLQITAGFTIADPTVPTDITAGCNTATAATPLTLKPGQSCETTITFPSGSAASGTLTVLSDSTNATNGSNVIQLTGEQSGLAATKLTISGTVPANSASAPATVNINYALACTACAGQSPSGNLQLYSGSTPIGTPDVTTGTGPYSFTSVPLPTGNNLVYAVYTPGSGVTCCTSATSPETLINVTGTASTIQLSASASTIATGSSVTLTAQIQPSSASDGTVTFKNGNTVVGTVQVSGGVATSQPIALSTVGTDTFTASYAGSATYNPSASAPVTVTVVQPIQTTTSVTPSPSSVPEGTSVTLTATVAATAGSTVPTGAAPTGSVTFYNGGSALGTVPLSGGQATYIATSLPQGIDSITATYSGDSLFVTSTSGAANVTVGAPASTTNLSVSSPNITVGQSDTLTATVKAASGNTIPTGTVTFSVGTTSLGTVSLDGSGNAVLTTTQIPGGTGSMPANQTVTATYNGSNSFSSSSGTASVSVTPVATSTGLVSTNYNPASNQQITLTATVTSSASIAPTGLVTFYNGSTSLGSKILTNGVAALDVSSLTQGTDSVTAVYDGANGFEGSTSPAITLTVSAPPSATTTTLAVSSSAVNVGQPVTFTATVTTTGTGTPGGVVSFENGGTPLGTGSSLNGNGVATFTTSSLAAATYTVTAIYQGTSAYTASTSNSVSVKVSPALTASTTTLTLSSTAVQQGQNVTFTAVVGPNSPISPTGVVTFSSGGQTLGQGSLQGGTATYSTAALNAANYNVTASYAGDSNFLGSSSNAVALAVAMPTPSFTMNATPSTLTLQSGQTGSAIITLIPTYNYAGTIALSCGTLPTNVTCSFSPATLTADGKNDAVRSTLTISTNNGTALLNRPGSIWGGRNNTVLSAAFFFIPVGLLGLGFTDKRKRLVRYLGLAVFVFLGTGILALSGCAGGNGGSSTDAPKGTSQITVTGTGSAGSQTQTVSFSVTIQ